MPSQPDLARDAAAFESDVWTDYWTCNVQFAAGIPVPDHYAGWPSPSRTCRALTPIFFDTCRRCGLPRGWEKRPRRKAAA